jgi:hypothetical protein
MRLLLNRCDVTGWGRTPQVCGSRRKIVLLRIGPSTTAVSPSAGGSFGGSYGEPMGVEGTGPISRISNLLIMIMNMAGFDPAIRRFESFHPSHITRREP